MELSKDAAWLPNHAVKFARWRHNVVGAGRGLLCARQHFNLRAEIKSCSIAMLPPQRHYNYYNALTTLPIIYTFLLFLSASLYVSKRGAY